MSDTVFEGSEPVSKHKQDPEVGIELSATSPLGLPATSPFSYTAPRRGWHEENGEGGKEGEEDGEEEEAANLVVPTLTLKP